MQAHDKAQARGWHGGLWACKDIEVVIQIFLSVSQAVRASWMLQRKTTADAVRCKP